MKTSFFFLFFLICFSVVGQNRVMLGPAKFHTGDNAAWKSPALNDKAWDTIGITSGWDNQGYADYDGFAWYRFHFYLPVSLKNKAFWKDSVEIYLSRIDDADEAFLNGVKIGQTGAFPNGENGYESAWDKPRYYHLSAKHPALKWNGENVIAVRVYDASGQGGMSGNRPYVKMKEPLDHIAVHLQKNTSGHPVFEVQNNYGGRVKGTLELVVNDPDSDKQVAMFRRQVVLPNGKTQKVSFPFKVNKYQRYDFTVKFTESISRKSVSRHFIPEYLCTPQAPETPRINGARVFGVRPGSPVLYKIAATGKKPLHYSVDNLPEGLTLDGEKGILTGTLPKRDKFHLTIQVSNALGVDTGSVDIVVGDLIGLTPQMGWNSWNCWGLSVNEKRVKSSAQALIDKGLIDHGWSYINIDDGWEAPQRAADGEILTNEKFPDMKALGSWLHAEGLKFGIYSSPGTTTCGGFLGSWQHEMQDAKTYSGWGVDYLKYDWCSYGDIYRKEGDTSLSAYQKPYMLMGQALQEQPRDIFYSLCQYGMKDVWQWGGAVNGNSWRTTGDITDSWESLSGIGFGQNDAAPYAVPGRWNDPDMLIVGNVGWGDHLHPTRLTPDEQYTHISLWSLLSAPLLIGCDIASMDDFTLNLLTNDEVIAVNQDPLGKSAIRKINDPGLQVWIKPLADGGLAIGIFNLKATFNKTNIDWNILGIAGGHTIRDLWRQKNIGTTNHPLNFTVSPHGVALVKIEK